MGTTRAISRGEVRRLREDLGLHQCDLAQLLDVAVTTVARWEMGQNRPRRRYAYLIQRLQAEKATLLKRQGQALRHIRMGLDGGLKPELLLRPEILHRVAEGDAATLQLLSALVRSPNPD